MDKQSGNILVTGATGQIGSELVPFLRNKYGRDKIIAAIHSNRHLSDELRDGPSVILDVTNRENLKKVIKDHNIACLYHLVGILSARGELDPDIAWNTNMLSLKNVLDLSVENKISKIFWPSSIAAFGSTTPRHKTPQQTVLEPRTMYGVTKVAGELLINYYFHKYHLDVRSLRLPGIISYKTEPGGGTTDYAVAIFYEALKAHRYTCFVRPDTVLPMMYMDDAIRAIDMLMEAPAERLTVRTSYNLTALSFKAEELAAAVISRIPDFICTYKPDFRQAIADSWPQTIDDSTARHDWGWTPMFTLDRMVVEMLKQLSQKLNM